MALRSSVQEEPFLGFSVRVNLCASEVAPRGLYFGVSVFTVWAGVGFQTFDFEASVLEACMSGW